MVPFSNRRQSATIPILVIEDQADQQRLIAGNLRDNAPGIRASFAMNAQQALDHLQQTQAQNNPGDFPRLILLDLGLPHPEQGWDLLNRIRDSYPRLPVVILTHSGRPADIDKAYDLGAHSFIQKPSRLREWDTFFRSFNTYWTDTIQWPPREA